MRTKSNVERHEEEIFRAAQSFTASLFQPHGQTIRKDFATFPEAVEHAKGMHDEYGRGGLVYAVTPAGRSVGLGPSEWPHYLAIWKDLHHGRG